MDKTMENPLCEWSVVVGRGDMPLRQGPHLSLLSAFLLSERRCGLPLLRWADGPDWQPAQSKCYIMHVECGSLWHGGKVK